MNEQHDQERQLLYRLMAENREHARRSEDRRIAITSVTVLTATGILVTLTFLPSSSWTLPLALWLTGLGAVGALLCLKLYERAQFHERRARQVRNRLIELAPEAGAQQAHDEAEAAHRREHPRLWSLRLNTLLVSLNVLAALLGVLYVVLALARPA